MPKLAPRLHLYVLVKNEQTWMAAASPVSLGNKRMTWTNNRITNIAEVCADAGVSGTQHGKRKLSFYYYYFALLEISYRLNYADAKRNQFIQAPAPNVQ